ncbi:MAG: glyceraldehyde-3-phosphate dehydrogenase [Proteobacteria bacterium]|nr:glyceraldehyde-3-phosphate dehydrogenase [Pseudomonadota bacterium]
MRHLISIIFLCFILLVLSPPVHSQSFLDQFIDPEDGMLDASEWLLEQHGFLPVPIVVTEPALGYGGGLALLFFHQSKEGKKSTVGEGLTESEREKSPTPAPSISGVLGLGTEDDSQAYGAFHFGRWRQDRIRYLGYVVRPSLSLEFYGGGDSPLLGNGIDYELEGWLFSQQLLFRIPDSNIFLGGRLSYFDSESTFDLDINIPGIDQWELDLENLGFGLVCQYDSRDNIFTPNTGVNAEASWTYYETTSSLGSDRDYQVMEAKSYAYWELYSRVVLGWRLDGRFSVDDVPFYALPYIALRGIPAMRYQGENAATTEIEARWNVTGRWALLGFGGVGRTADSISDLGNGDSRWAGGAGIRYLVARLFGLYTGVDIARGPEDWSFYVQVGSAWNY